MTAESMQPCMSGKENMWKRKYGIPLLIFLAVLVVHFLELAFLGRLFISDGRSRTILFGNATLDRGDLNSSNSCDYPIVYNKPHKTGSTFIQNAINSWAGKVGRPTYACSSWAHSAAVRLRECLPSISNPCGIYNGHLLVDQNVDDLLQKSFPGYHTVTSTRYAPHRIVSLFMQKKGIKVEHIRSTDNFNRKLKDYLLNEFNPYEIVAWYLRRPMEYRSCPMDESVQNFMNGIAKTDIVIDVNLLPESNVILKHFGLFTLPEISNRTNERGAYNLELPPDVKSVLYNVSCYERALHHALLLRMASLYGEARKRQCVRHGRLHVVSSCLHVMERHRLNSSWIF